MGLFDTYIVPKEVKIKDPCLGCCHLMLTVAIFVFIVIYQILLNNEHFERADVQGFVRLQLQHPTQNKCDPKKAGCLSDYRPMSSLPYCKQYEGNVTTSTAGDAILQKPCLYRDELTMNPFSSAGVKKIFIPTRGTRMIQNKVCDATKDGCVNTYAADASQPALTYYSADVERFTLLIDHSFESKSPEIDAKGSHIGYTGFWKVCEDPEDESSVCSKVPIPCKGSHCDSKDKKHTYPWVKDNFPWIENVYQKYFGEQPVATKPTTAPTTAPTAAPAAVTVTAAAADTVKKTDTVISLREVQEADLDYAQLAKAFSQDYVVGESEGMVMADHWEQYRHAMVDASGKFILDPHTTLTRAQLMSKRHIHHPVHLGGGNRDTAVETGADGTPSSIFQIRAGDIISVGQLLEIAGIDLDNNNYNNESIRKEGLILTITIEYKNDAPLMTFFHAPIQYTYSVKVEKAPGYKNVITFENGETRTCFNKHGIFIQVDQNGKVAQLSITYFILMLTSALALTEIAKMITEFMAFNLMPHSEEYDEAKSDETRNFGSQPLCGVFAPEEDPAPTDEDLGEIADKLKNGVTLKSGVTIKPPTDADALAAMLKRDKELAEKMKNATAPYNTWREATAILLAEIHELKKTNANLRQTTTGLAKRGKNSDYHAVNH